MKKLPVVKRKEEETNKEKLISKQPKPTRNKRNKSKLKKLIL